MYGAKFIDESANEELFSLIEKDFSNFVAFCEGSTGEECDIFTEATKKENKKFIKEIYKCVKNRIKQEINVSTYRQVQSGTYNKKFIKEDSKDFWIMFGSTKGNVARGISLPISFGLAFLVGWGLGELGAKAFEYVKNNFQAALLGAGVGGVAGGTGALLGTLPWHLFIVFSEKDIDRVRKYFSNPKNIKSLERYINDRYPTARIDVKVDTKILPQNENDEQYRTSFALKFHMNGKID